MEVRFVILAPSKSRKPYSTRLPVVIGRGDEAKLRIQQDSVSRRHCEFAYGGDVVTVTDLGSTNGTLVGGKRIEPHVATPVLSGTEVRIGTTVLRVEYAVAAAASSDADTTPLTPLTPLLDAAAEPTQPEPVAEAAPEPDARAADPAETEPAAAPAAGDPGFPDPEPVADAGDLAAVAGAEPAPPPPDGSFDFLGAEAESPPAADDQLDDFFKSLS